MADLAKYGRVTTIKADDHRDVVRINDLLQEGWELIIVKIVETQGRQGGIGPAIPGHIWKKAETHFILGKRRDHKSPGQIRESQVERARVDREGQQ